MRLVISGGGTGGHIYPALALIEALKAEGKLDDVLYVGTQRGLESRMVHMWMSLWDAEAIPARL